MDEDSFLELEGLCRSCHHPLAEHFLASGLGDDIPTYRYSCVARVGDGFCECYSDRQELIEATEAVN